MIRKWCYFFRPFMMNRRRNYFAFVVQFSSSIITCNTGVRPKGKWSILPFTLAIKCKCYMNTLHSETPNIYVVRVWDGHNDKSLKSNAFQFSWLWCLVYMVKELCSVKGTNLSCQCQLPKDSVYWSLVQLLNDNSTRERKWEEAETEHVLHSETR